MPRLARGRDRAPAGGGTLVRTGAGSSEQQKDMPQGRVSWFTADEGFGSIAPDDVRRR